MIFTHELCTDFRLKQDMSHEEAKRFHEAFSHFHKVMTDINNQPLKNALYLNDNFLELWAKYNPQEMLEICVKKSFEYIGAKE